MSVAVGLFAKPLIPGTVKTRLSPPLSSDEATALYRAFLVDTAIICSSNPDWEFYVFSPDPASQEATWSPDAPKPHSFRRQRGSDLGERLHHAFLEIFSDGHTPAVLVGSDHPTLPASHITEALHKIRWADVVLGPSHDGGYYLIGFNQPPPSSLLDNIPWSTSHVLRDTLERVHAAGLRGCLTHPWYDVDTLEDLMFLAQELALTPPSPKGPSATAKALDELPSHLNLASTSKENKKL